MKEWLNKFLYLPSLGTFLLNLVFFAVTLTLASGFGLFSDSVNAVTAPLFGTDNSFWRTILLLLAILAASFALIYGRTEKYFLCSRQSLRAAAGSTVVVTLLFAGVWSVIQIHKSKQRLALFNPAKWDARVALNDLKYGGLLFLFSSISLAGSLAISGRLGYDFTPFLDDWKECRASAEKLSRNEALSYEEHDSLMRSMNSLIKRMGEMGGYSQPVSRVAVERAREPLVAFQEWYVEQTRISYANCRGLDSSIRDQVQKILNLC